MNNVDELTEKIIDLCLIYEIKDSEIYIKLLDSQIKFYESRLSYLRESKPFFFQKKKLNEYFQKVEECEQKINNAYLKLAFEFDWITKSHNDLID